MNEEKVGKTRHGKRGAKETLIKVDFGEKIPYIPAFFRRNPDLFSVSLNNDKEQSDEKFDPVYRKRNPRKRQPDR